MVTIEQKAKAYDEALERAKGAHNSAKSDKENGVTDKITEYTVQLTETIFPELKESEDERIRKALIHFIGEQDGFLTAINGISVKKIISWLEKQAKKDEEILILKDKIESLHAAIIAIKETHKIELEKQGKKELVTCPICGWEIEKQGKQKPAELPKGEDYGIDSLYHAKRILEKTLGSVDGYQSDDGILEHKAAITAVKKLYEQPTAWSEGDDKCLRLSIDIIDSALRAGFCVQLDRDRCVDWLKSLRPQNRWKPSEEQIQALDEVYKTHGANNVCRRVIFNLMNELKKLMK